MNESDTHFSNTYLSPYTISNRRSEEMIRLGRNTLESTPQDLDRWVVPGPDECIEENELAIFKRGRIRADLCHTTDGVCSSWYNRVRELEDRKRGIEDDSSIGMNPYGFDFDKD